MSLEQAIERNTAALEALLAVLTKPAVIVQGAAIDLSDVQAPAAVTEQPKAKRAKKEAAPEPAPLEPSAPAPAVGASDASVTEAVATPVDDAPVEPVTRDQVSRALTTVASRKGRSIALGILQNVKANSLSDVDPNDYAAVLCACELALA